MNRPRQLFDALMISALTITAVGCGDAQTSADAVAKVDAACRRVREANEKLSELDLEAKGDAVANDPRVQQALRESAEASQELADRLDAAASGDGRLGQLKRAIVNNRRAIRQAVEAVVNAEKQSIVLRVRLARKVADLAGADACA